MSEIYKAIGYLIAAGIIALIYHFAKSQGLSRDDLLLKGFGACFLLAVVLTFTLGQPTCEESDYSIQGSSCIEYADDGYTPTTEEYFGKFVFYMLVFYVPTAFAAFNQKEV